MPVLTGLFLAGIFSVGLIYMGRAAAAKREKRPEIIAQIRKLQKRKAELEARILKAASSDSYKELVDHEKEKALNKVMSWADEEQKRLETLFHSQFANEMATARRDIASEILSDLESLNQQLGEQDEQSPVAAQASIKGRIQTIINKLNDSSG
jgi:hypothetical protein